VVAAKGLLIQFFLARLVLEYEAEQGFFDRSGANLRMPTSAVFQCGLPLTQRPSN